jgi:hypothetical protein
VAEKDRMMFSLSDTKSGKTWGPVPLLALEVHDTTIRRTERLERYRIDLVEKVDGGVHIVVGHSQYRVEVGL